MDLSLGPNRRPNVVWILCDQLRVHALGYRGNPTVCTPGNDWLLFHNAEDAFEQANEVYDRSYQGQKERCHALLRRWIERTGDQFDLPDTALPG